MENLAQLLKDARPLDDDEWGSERQIAAENALFGVLADKWPDEFGEGSDFAMWGLKATTDELLDEAERRLKAMGAI